MGIDFGNDNCVIAVARRGGIDMAVNQCSNRATPTVVGFGSEGRMLGEAGKTGMLSNIKSTVKNIKRYIGRSLAEPSLQEELPFQCAQTTDGEREVAFSVPFEGEQQTFEATKVCGMMFQDLKTIAELECKAPVVDCVIGVPGYWSDRQRRALRDAASMAGFKVLRVLSESVAAAVAYGCNPKRELPKEGEDPLNVMILDMGHSNFQVSMCQFIKGKVTVLGSVTDCGFGGRNFDMMLVEYFAKQFQEKNKVNLMEHKKAQQRLLAACEKCKTTLSANMQAGVNVECIFEEYDINGKITRDELEEMAKPLLERAMSTVDKLMADLSFSPDQVNFVEMTGGASRIPCVGHAVAIRFGEEKIARTLISSEPVARGCALQAAMISPAFKVFDFTVQDIVANPVSLCWKTVAGEGATPTEGEDGEEGEGDMEVDDTAEVGDEKTMVIFEAGSANPATKLVSFHRKEGFEIRAEYTNQEDLPEGCDKFIGKFNISGIQSDDGEPKKVKAKVKFTPDGVVSVESAEQVEVYYVEVEVPKPEAPKDDKAEDPAKPEETPAPNDEAPAANTDGAPMDTEETPAEEKVEKKRKKKVKKTPLKVEGTTWSLDDGNMQKATELLLELAMKDKLIQDTLDRKNAVESYVYETRDAVDMHLRAFISDDDRTTFMAALNESEDWLYGDGENCTKSEYVARLEQLKTMGDPVVLRHKEAESRGPALANLKKAIEEAHAFVASTDEKYEHISPEDRQKVTDVAAAAQKWLDENEAAQAAKAQTEAPAFLTSAAEAQITPVLRETKNVSSKPKPKPPPPPVEEKAAGEEEAPAEGEAPAAQTESAPADMDVD